MPQPGNSLFLRRRIIGRHFMELRRSAGLTQRQAALLIQRSPAHVARIEEGHESVRFRDHEVAAYLDALGAPVPDRARLMALTAETRSNGQAAWWHSYTQSDLPSWFRPFVLLEDAAVRIRQFEFETIPGLLQTRGYAEAIHSVPAGWISEDEVQRRVSVRMERQARLGRSDAPQLEVVMSEAALRRVVGTPAMMARQLQQVLTVAQRGNVSVRVLPFAAGVHGGMGGNSPFMILDFPVDERAGSPLEPPMVYVDTLTGALYLTTQEEVDAYQSSWDDLTERSLGQQGSWELIDTIRKGYVP